MPQSDNAYRAKLKADLQKLKMSAPEVSRSFGALHLAVMKEGALAIRDKELIALAIGIAQGCEDCIYLHTEAATKAGATREQVIEAAGVAVMMQGGPAFVHIPSLIAALDSTGPALS